MNTISIGRGWSAGKETAQRFVSEEDSRPGGPRYGRIDVRSPSFPARVRRAAGKAAGRPVWFQNESDFNLEKFLLLLLAVAGVLGIAYGFSCLIDLVQSWAIMERGVINVI